MGALAQMVERVLCTHQVRGSNPLPSMALLVLLPYGDEIRRNPVPVSGGTRGAAPGARSGARPMHADPMRVDTGSARQCERDTEPRLTAGKVPASFYAMQGGRVPRHAGNGKDPSLACVPLIPSGLRREECAGRLSFRRSISGGQYLGPCALFFWGVTQSGRVPALGAGGRRFESCLPDQNRSGSVITAAIRH